MSEGIDDFIFASSFSIVSVSSIVPVDGCFVTVKSTAGLHFKEAHRSEAVSSDYDIGDIREQDYSTFIAAYNRIANFLD